MNDSFHMTYVTFSLHAFLSVRINVIQYAMDVSMVNAFHLIIAIALMVINGISAKIISAFQFVNQIAQMENVLHQIIVVVMIIII